MCKILDHAVYDSILKVKTPHLNFTQLPQVALRGNCTDKYLRCDGPYPKLVDFPAAQLWAPMKYPDGVWTFENQWHYLTIDNTGRVICQGMHYHKRYEMLMLERLAGKLFALKMDVYFISKFRGYSCSLFIIATHFNQCEVVKNLIACTIVLSICLQFRSYSYLVTSLLSLIIIVQILAYSIKWCRREVRFFVLRDFRINQ